MGISHLPYKVISIITWNTLGLEGILVILLRDRNSAVLNIILVYKASLKVNESASYEFFSYTTKYAPLRKTETFLGIWSTRKIFITRTYNEALYTKIFRTVDFLSLNNITIMPSKPSVFRVFKNRNFHIWKV